MWRSSNRTGVIFSLVAVCSLTLYVVVLWSNWRETSFDDAYMYVRYARNLLDGNGIAWNPDGVQTFGTTSLLYLFLIAGCTYLIPIKSGLLLPLISWIFGLLSLVTLTFTCARNIKSDVLKSFPMVAAIIMLGVTFQDAFLYHTLTGMETTLSILCNTLLILSVMVLLKNPSPSKGLVVGLCSYLAFLARPDQIICALLFPILSILLLLQEGRRELMRTFVATILSLLVVDTIVKYFVFGSPVPLGVYVKTIGFYDGYLGQWNPVNFLEVFLVGIIPFLWMIILGAGRGNMKTIVVFFVPVILTFLSFFSISQIMGAAARYYAPSIPFFVVGGMLALDDLVSRNVRLQISPEFFVRLLVSLFLLLFLPSTYTGKVAAGLYAEAFIRQKPIPVEGHSSMVEARQLPALTGWQGIVAMTDIANHLPRGTVIAASEVGYLGASCPNLTLIDLAGLNDNEIARRGFSFTYVFARKPDLIWMPHPDYSGLVSAIVSDKKFVQEYLYYPSAYNYGIAVRRNSPFTLIILESIRSSWRNVYLGIPMNDVGNEK